MGDDYDPWEAEWEFEPVDHPAHIYPISENDHDPDACCWCFPELVIPCCCDGFSKANRKKGDPNPICVMCYGTGYIPADIETCTLIIHFDQKDRDERSRHRH